MLLVSCIITIIGILCDIKFVKKTENNISNYKLLLMIILAFSFSHTKFGITVESIKITFLIFTLIVISYIDFKNSIIPNQFIVIILLLGIIFNAIDRCQSLLSIVIGFFIISGPMLLTYIVTNRSIGGGDIKLMAVVGMFIGAKKIVIAFFVSSCISSIILLLLLVLRKIKIKDKIPYAPFLSIGILISSLYGECIFK